MLSLTDQQLELVMGAAKLLPPHRRDDFLRSICSRLDDVDRPSDSEVGEAIDFILSARGISVDRTLLRPRRQQATQEITPQCEPKTPNNVFALKTMTTLSKTVS